MYHIVTIVFFCIFMVACATDYDRAQDSQPAAPEVDAPVIVEVDDYREFLSDLRASLNEGEPREMNPSEADRYNRLHREIDGILASIDSVEELSDREQRELYNLNEELWTTVVGRDEDQVICRREHTVGTNFKATRCRTVSEIRRDQQDAQDYLRRSTLRYQLPEGG